MIWLHGAQAQTASDVKALAAVVKGDEVPWLAINLTNGRNRILNALESCPKLQVRTLASPATAEQIEFAMHLAFSPEARWTRTLRRVDAAPDLGPECSTHLTRLWAMSEVERQVASNVPGAREEAVRLAHKLQLVTPVSAAVVLENDEQYEDAGLTPAKPADVPGVPEPESMALLLVAGSIGLWYWLRRRRGAQIAA